jgi:hypothetical protein
VIEYLLQTDLQRTELATLGIAVDDER